MEFRPPLALRLLLGCYGVLCIVAVCGHVVVAVAQKEPIRLTAVLILLACSVLAVALLRQKIEVSDEGLRAVSAFGARFIPWSAVRRLDQMRHTFVVFSEAGTVSAGWLFRREREQLLRLILQHAKLTASPEKLRWGLVARYVPRAQNIRPFV
jgi:hypothetical protein